MATRKFLTSVADVYGYYYNPATDAETLAFTGRTLLDSSIEVSLGSAPVRGGKGNQLQYTYYHTGEMKFTLTDTQWNLFMLGATVGSDPTTSNNVYTEENAQINVSSNTVTATITGTPLAFGDGTIIYGWATLPSGNIVVGTFSGSNFTGTKLSTDTATTGDYACIRYYALDADSVSVTVSANMLPKIVRLVMETQLNSADVSTNKIGVVQIIAPTVQLSGAFTISMKADGVANTPLTATALAYTDSGTTTPCSSEPYYAKIIEIIDSANWYDNVIALAIQGGDFTMATTSSDVTLTVWAIPAAGASFIPPYTDLLFTSETTAVATVGLQTGVVSAVAATGTNTSVITVQGDSGTTINSIEAKAKVTVTP